MTSVPQGVGGLVWGGGVGKKMRPGSTDTVGNKGRSLYERG